MTNLYHTLADCTVLIPLRCMHCDRELPKSTPIEVYGKYVVAECLEVVQMKTEVQGGA